AVRLGVVGLERNCLVVACQRLRGTFEIPQRIAAIAVRLGVVWLERNCLVVAYQRFRGTLQVYQCIAQVAVSSSNIRLEPDSLFDQFNCPLCSLCLTSNDSE